MERKVPLNPSFTEGDSKLWKYPPTVTVLLLLIPPFEKGRIGGIYSGCDDTYRLRSPH
jgi:hypothetical protein